MEQANVTCANSRFLGDFAPPVFEKLGSADRDRIETYLLGLAAEDRRCRFHGTSSDTMIHRYLESIDWDAWFGIGCRSDGRLAGLAEAVLESPAEGIVEIGIVIDPHIRGIGVGTALVRELLSVAAHAGARKAVFRFNPCDPRIPSIVRSLGGRVSLRDEEGHVDATTFGRRSDAPIASAAAEGVPRTRDTRDMFR